MKSEYVIKFLVDSFRASAYRKLVTLSNTSLRFVVHAHIYVVVCAQSCCERILVWAQTCPSFHSKCRYYKKANEIPSLEPSIPVFVQQDSTLDSNIVKWTVNYNININLLDREREAKVVFLYIHKFYMICNKKLKLKVLSLKNLRTEVVRLILSAILSTCLHFFFTWPRSNINFYS